MIAKGDIAAKAFQMGFASIGFCDPVLPPHKIRNYQNFVRHKAYGSMEWLNNPKRLDPKLLWSEAKSVIVLGMNYTPLTDPLLALKHRHRANISVYARNQDYHKSGKKMLKALAQWLTKQAKCEARVFLDTAPLLEKPLAQQAGIGWQGKHSNLVSRQFGSWLFLGEIFTDTHFTHSPATDKPTPNAAKPHTSEVNPSEPASNLSAPTTGISTVSPTADLSTSVTYSPSATAKPPNLEVNPSAHSPLGSPIDSTSESSTPHPNLCGSCRACIDICPTNAITPVQSHTNPTDKASHSTTSPSDSSATSDANGGWRLDPQKCISYLTIEHKGEIPKQFRRQMGNRIYGCDDCLAVCPWNKFARKPDPTFSPQWYKDPPLELFLDFDDAKFRSYFAKTAIKRLGRNNFLRNVLIAVGNSGNTDLVPKLKPLLKDSSPVVQEAASWALEQLA